VTITSSGERQKVSWLARAGLVTRGLLNVVVGWIALRIALGDQGRRADQKGALATLVRQPLGRGLVLALAVGFLGYAVWRFFEAATNPEDDSVWQRVGRALRGVLYLGFCWSALHLAFGGASSSSAKGSSSSSSETQDITAKVLAWGTLGRGLVAVAGVVLIGMGAWNGWRAISKSFEKDLKRYEMSATARRWTTRMGEFGHLARMVAYFVCGGFLVRAAVRFDPHQGVGLDGALHEMASHAYGSWLLVVVAVGLVSFGAYQFVLARYRSILGE
jgi:hypothetical protein